MGQLKHLVQEYHDVYINYCAGEDNLDELTRLREKYPFLKKLDESRALELSAYCEDEANILTPD